MAEKPSGGNTPSYGGTPSRLADVRARVGHVPLVRRHQFVLSFLALLVGYGLFLLPAPGARGLLGLAAVVLFVLLAMAWAVILFTDELKPEYLKTITVFVLLALGGWLYYRYSTGRWSEMTHLFFNLEVMRKALPILMQGFWTTLLMAAAAAVISTILGLLLAVFRSFGNPVLNLFIIAYVDFFRSMPILVLMMVIYYALPFLNIRLSAVMSGIIALGLNSSAYVSEIFRAGFLSIKRGQFEAAHALGLTPMQTMRLVLLPQAFRVVLPPLVGNYVASAKDTALASGISIIELLKAALSQKSLLANPSPLIFSAALYLVMFVPLTRLSGLLEKRMKAGVRQVRL
jgi:polar amino acid transport system permease protein